MHKQLLLLSLISTIFLSGCSSYSATKYFKKDEFFSRAMQYTKKANIYKGDTVIAMINATYLNSVDKKFNNDYENFVIGIYHTAKKTTGLDNNSFMLLLNNKKPLIINPLEKKDKLNNLPLKNNWAKYYVVSFEKEKVDFFKNNKSPLILTYENKKEREVALMDKEKEPKNTTSWKASLTFLKQL